MKRLVFIMLLCMGIQCTQAQKSNKEKFSLATTLGTGIPMSTPPSTPIIWQVLGYYNLTERWAIGIGTGLSFYEKTLIPLYGDVRFQIGKQRKFTPFAEFAIGSSFAASSDANGGFFMNPSVGIQYPIKNKVKLQLAIGYEWQEMKRLKKHADEYFLKEFSEELYHNSISVRIGVRF